MEKKQERIGLAGLIFITVLSAIQYVFLQNVPEDIPAFAFVCITNVIGLLLLSLIRIKQAATIRRKTLLKGILFALELTGINFFILLGSRSLDAVVISSICSLYFLFVTPMLLASGHKVSFFSLIASVIAVIALLLMFGADTDSLFASRSVIYLVIADIIFAAYVVSVSIFGRDEDATQLSVSQMLFSAVFAFAGWCIECAVRGTGLSLPGDRKFWISALFIGVSIRALYSLIQISSQKKVSALKASLVFASEILITLITEPFMCWLLHFEYKTITVFQVIGGFLFIISSLMIDESFMKKLGYDNILIAARKDQENKSSVSKKIISTTLSFSLVTLILSTLICLGAIHFIRTRTVASSSELGQNSADISSAAMKDQLEVNISNQAADKTLLAEQKLAAYSNSIQNISSFAHSLYANADDYPRKEVQKPMSANVGKWTMQRVIADESIDYADLKDECMLLGNLEVVFAPMVNHLDNIATVYLGTETGLMVSYDPSSVDEDFDGELYYDFRQSGWYKLAKESDSFVFSNTYQDAAGRGLTITCAAPFFDEKGRFAGCVAVDVLMSDLNESMVNDSIVIPSYAVLIDSRGNYIAGRNIDSSLENMGTVFDEDKDNFLRMAGDTILSNLNGITVQGEGDDEVYIAFSQIKSTGWILCIISPVSTVIRPAQEIKSSIDSSTQSVVESVTKGILTVIQSCLVLSAIILIFATLFTGRISKRISDPLKTLDEDVQAISAGDFDRRTDVVTNDEVGSLAQSFNYMTESLQKHIADLKEITAKEERIAMELSLAANIQASMLPKDFDMYSSLSEFKLYASMIPAKEVGGDFYDFFMIDDRHLALVMADVSGKGVPAALFMVKAKTSIKMRAVMGGTPSEILEDVNAQMCEGNNEELFVTVWLAVLDIKTGKGIAANAGHEYPAVRRAGGNFGLVQYRHSPPVATMERMRFREHEFELHPGDSLFVYTDGVTEATDADNGLFGTDRMLEALNVEPDAEPTVLLKNVKEHVDRFVGEAPQFDDLTMLCLKYFGKASEQTSK